MNSNTHVICIPFPAIGHVKPMLNLARVLHSNFNFNITFITTHHIHQTLFFGSNGHHSPTCHTFTLHSIPDEDWVDDPKDIVCVVKCIGRLEQPLKEVLTRIRTQNGGSTMTWMVSDVALTSFVPEMSDEVGITGVVLETTGGCSMMGYLQLRQLMLKGIIPIKDPSYLTNGYLEKVIDWIPSLPGIRLKDMPTFLRTTDRHDMMLNTVISNAYKVLKSKAILINTFDELEQDIVKELSNFSPNIYPIGPLHLLANNVVNNNTSKVQPKYMQWLDSQDPNSVLFVSFGTIVATTNDQFVELAWGLANSDQKFLWVVRSDLVDQPDFLPLGFAKAIEGKGMLVSWCDQEQVLAHPSIGGFLTHCGWNSTLESISNGVPMICWPFEADQVINCWYCCNCLGIGLKMNEEVKREEVERVVRERMEGMRGKEMKKTAMEWRRLAREATKGPHGSSYHNLENVISNIIHSLSE